ncbi:predicted protein [Arabidopsis lyrata subsp. lyrata]|uniref:Predicted protein n=1 Tax=Arabidopsis lyrata subsp. lyrata TaxID=81972 RepID=D7MJV6_ARALL|nr:predicted protein [Arabidopsis lyrata subsp. lyrata]
MWLVVVPLSILVMSHLVCGCGFVETAERLRTPVTVILVSPLCLVLVLVSDTHRKSLIGELGKAACAVWLDFFFLAMVGAGLVLCRRIKICDFLFLEARFSGVAWRSSGYRWWSFFLLHLHLSPIAHGLVEEPLPHDVEESVIEGIETYAVETSVHGPPLKGFRFFGFLFCSLFSFHSHLSSFVAHFGGTSESCITLSDTPFDKRHTLSR